jgi:acetoacetyl-CoA reductase
LGIAVRKCDVGDFAQCKAAVEDIERQLGPVDILVNNAGITRDATMHKMTPEQWEDVIRVDLFSVFNMCRQVIEGMRARGFGRIVNISSINGQKGQFGQTNYCAAKAGIIGFTKALALETAAKGVIVNAIAPGYIETDMVAAVPAEILQTIKTGIPIGRLGRPEEIARCVSFLASDDAAFITGATLSANGGQYMVG